MGGRQIRPATVWKTKQLQLTSQVLKDQPVERPPWFNVLASCPPGETIVRPIPQQHINSYRSKKQRKPKAIYKPQRIDYPEDKLRRTFFMDHPWELARPRNLVEQDGKDYQMLDWSKGLRQPGVPLTGESVVQRQLYLIENEDKSVRHAYDLTRRDFYRLRQQEQIERRIAEEEARYVGAYFGKTRNEVGMQLEDNQFENWKVWAGKQNQDAQLKLSQESAVVSYDQDADTPLDGSDEKVEGVEEARADAAALAKDAEKPKDTQSIESALAGGRMG